MRSSGLMKKYLVAAFVPIAAGGALLAMNNPVYASEDQAVPTKYPWSHREFYHAFDHASIRRGLTVYKEVCATCHSLERVAYRTLVGVVMTEPEAKALAAETTIIDGLDDEGQPLERPRELKDYFPSPYENEVEARSANGGALPPDLSLMTKARPHGEDYVYALLGGYAEPPHGVELRPGLYYNAYFPGGAIGMPPPIIMNDQVEYADGTPATMSQMAKDVTTFLCWAAEPEHDERKRMGLKTLFLLSMMAASTFYFKRLKWSIIKTRHVTFF